jgi:hypothetical protein
MSMIRPTVGRIVWYWPTRPTSLTSQPFAAIITRVHSDTAIDLMVMHPIEGPIPTQWVGLFQEGEEVPDTAAYAEWMPYQQGQAAKAEAAEAALAQGFTRLPDPGPKHS